MSGEEKLPVVLTRREHTYIFTGESLVERLGLEGHQVTEIWFKDGVWHLKTAEVIK